MQVTMFPRGGGGGGGGGLSRGVFPCVVIGMLFPLISEFSYTLSSFQFGLGGINTAINGQSIIPSVYTVEPLNQGTLI